MIRNIDEGPQPGLAPGLAVLGSQPFLEESAVLVQKGGRRRREEPLEAEGCADAGYPRQDGRLLEAREGTEGGKSRGVKRLVQRGTTELIILETIAR